MGWKDRGWYLGDTGRRCSTGSGNAGPTVWVDGRVVGGWAQRADGAVVYELLEDVGRASTAEVTKAAAKLEAWIGDVRIKPRFPTPLHKQLVAWATRL